MTCVPSEDSDQPGHPPSPIRVFAVRMKKHWALNYLLSASEDRSDLADAQADMSLRWTHRPFSVFCRAAADVSQFLQIDGRLLSWCLVPAVNIHILINLVREPRQKKNVHVRTKSVCIYFALRDHTCKYSFWATSWKKPSMPYANNQGTDQPFLSAQLDQRLCCSLPRYYYTYTCLI